LKKGSDSESDAHHEEGFSAQKSFKEQTNNLIHVFEEFESSFLDDNNELFTLDTRNTLDEAVISTVQNIQKIGRDQYVQYCKDVIIERTRSIYDPIKKNSLSLFSCPQPKKGRQTTEKISMLKSDITLFSRSYIVMQHRDSDMSTLFRHENHLPYLAVVNCGSEKNQICLIF